ncbi:hypothetical protein K1T35_32875 [Pseudonocardia sp. DSM 110487]|uniref:hypothetical protein n=1 Tax=Pseudonocardia sp. DSM 110487 TaxID=2865833 RepID=UPI001C6A774E|nr:hypothetical protein [Pseudonocardia sp. DSM 110487]QYN40956.1 hypothetical protein K1T35_32875 [Pseudonocardia sp. DSM 110487]
MTTEVQWSELQRDPRGVAALADRGDVRVRRREGVPLLLVREDRAEAAADGALAVARTLRTALLHLDEAAHEALTEEFPWLDKLPVDDRRRFASEFGQAVQASAELGQWDVLSQALFEWRATAEIHADPSLAAELSRPVDDDLGPVPVPEGSSGTSDRWEPRFATSEAAKGWEELCRVATGPAEAWAALAERPARPHEPARRHRLRGRLAERRVGERTLQQWHLEVAGSGRVWYCTDAERRVVWVVAAAPVRPRVGG